MPDGVNVTLHPGSHLLLDGLLITGRGVRVSQGEPDPRQAQTLPKAQAHLTLRHCTLVPGWGLESNCDPRRPAEPSLELTNVHGNVTIDRTILGSIQVNHDEVQTDPVPIEIRDSLLDATGPEG